MDHPAFLGLHQDLHTDDPSYLSLFPDLLNVKKGEDFCRTVKTAHTSWNSGENDRGDRVCGEKESCPRIRRSTQ
ncbi:MAG: hypothetical protein Q8R88_05115, partial [Desulfoprunum sp.]|nr:hypothetical protein [Desulfoprunum sp.]